jgi:hypothetical protein
MNRLRVVTSDGFAPVVLLPEFQPFFIRAVSTAWTTPHPTHDSEVSL